MNVGSKLIAVDVDDVLVHIATPWVAKITKYLPRGVLTMLNGEDLSRAVRSRVQPHIQEWLVQEHGLMRHQVDEVNLTYRADPTFYDDLLPTALCRGLWTALELPGRIAHVHVITHNYSNDDPCVESKDRWLRKWVGSPNKVTIHHVEAGDKKSSVMANHCPDMDSFADDSMSNVVDVLLNDAVRPNEILIPRMGHNVASGQVRHLAALRRIQLNYYENVL